MDPAPVVLPLTDAMRSRHRVQQLLDSGALSMVFQPIVELDTRAMVGTEALARFSAEPNRGPQAWFADAGQAGLLTELEICAITKALGWCGRLPEGVLLYVNASPSTLATAEFLEAVPASIASRVVIEVAAEATVRSYRLLEKSLGHLRESGAKLAVDDAGSGAASLSHLAKLRPEVIKLDGSLTRGVAGDVAIRAIARGLVAFADELGASVIAEAIETEEELEALIALGVHHGQGFLFGHPAALA